MSDKFNLQKMPGLSRRTLLLSGLSGLSTGAVMILGACANRNPQTSSNRQSIAVPLTPAPFASPGTFSFETVTVNEAGQIVKREQKQARYFTQTLGSNTQFKPVQPILEMVEIPAGEFMMGSPENEANRNESESPQHLVKVPRFFMGRFEVTEAQWRSLMGKDPLFPMGEQFAVKSLLWSQAQRFCQALSEQTGRNYRLPSEAEWEYACRAGTTTPFSYGMTAYGSVATEPNSDGSFTIANPVPVGSFAPNPFGLHDMHGNEWEWCEDEWHDNYQGAPTDGSAWVSSGDRVLNRVARGGSYGSLPWECRSAARANKQVSVGSAGLRVVCAG